MTKQRTLADLYVRGKEATVGEGDEAFVVWIQKLNPVEHATAVRRANAAKARVLSCRFDKEGDEYQSHLAEVLSYSKEVLVEILAAAEESQITLSREAKVADLDEWKKDDYLVGLRDIWLQEMSERFVDEPDDPEAKRIHDELQRFTKAVQDEIAHEMESFRVGLSQMSERELVDSVMENRLKVNGDVAWLNEYHKMEVALGTRKRDDHHQKLFENRAAVDELQLQPLRQLVDAFSELNVDPLEGKGSAGLPPSSPSSEQSEPEATPDPSGQPAAAA